MRTEARLFLGIALFLFISAAIYGIWSKEEIGATALILAGGLNLLCGTYFAFVARRIQPRPEDRADAEISEGAGEIGFFPPASYWPFTMGLAVMLTGIGVAFWYSWLLALGGVAILLSVGGFIFEFYLGQEK